MTNADNAISNWTLATGTKPGERDVYVGVPKNTIAATPPSSDARSNTDPVPR